MPKQSPLSVLASKAAFALGARDFVKDVPLPPKHLVDMHKDPKSGYEFANSLMTWLAEEGVDVKAGSLFDIGCGWGRLAYGLMGAGFEGDYVGVDVNARQIDFLTRNFAPKAPSFTFGHVDYQNDFYNADATSRSLDLRRHAGAGDLDAIILLSVFTHMFDADILPYLDEISALMAPGTKLVFTAFTYDSKTLARIGEGKGRFAMSHVLSDHCRCETKAEPLYAIAYDRDWLGAELAARGLAHRIVDGNWSGLKSKRGQDWIVATRKE